MIGASYWQAVKASMLRQIATPNPRRQAEFDELTVLLACGNRPSSKSIRSGMHSMSLRSAIPISFFRRSSRGVIESRHPGFDANPFRTKRSPSFNRRPFSKHHSRISSSVPPCVHTLNQIAMMHTQEIAAHAVCRFQRTEVFLIIFVQFAAQMQPNLVQHAREIHHAARHFLRASGINSHERTNRMSAPKTRSDGSRPTRFMPTARKRRC